MSEDLPSPDFINDKVKDSLQSVDYSVTMLQRWQKTIRELPDIDKKDIAEDSPIFNKNKTTGCER